MTLTNNQSTSPKDLPTTLLTSSQSLSNDGLLLDILLIERKKHIISVIYLNKNQEITFTEPSTSITIPLLSNYPKRWFIPTQNATHTSSPNLSIIQIDFQIHNQENLLIQSSFPKEKLCDQLDEFLRFQSSFQGIFANNNPLREEIIKQVANRGWNYSKHVPWNMIKIDRRASGKKKVYSLSANYQLKISDQSACSQSYITMPSTTSSTPTSDIQSQKPKPISQQDQSNTTSVPSNPNPAHLNNNQYEESSMSIDLDFPIPSDIDMGISASSYLPSGSKSNFPSNPANSSNILSPPGLNESLFTPNRSPSPITQSPHTQSSSSLSDIRASNPPNYNLDRRQIFKTREEQAYTRLMEYENSQLTKSTDIENYKPFDHNDDSDDEADRSNSSLTEGTTDHHRIVHWASKLPSVRSDPQEIINLLLEIHKTPKDTVRQKPRLAIFTKIEARDRQFFRSFSKTNDLKSDHQKEYEKLERRFQNNYKARNKISYLNRETRSKIRQLLNACLLIAYLRYINIFDLSPFQLTQILEFGCNYFYYPQDAEVLDRLKLLRLCREMFQNNLPPLPPNPEMISPEIKAKIPHKIPIADRSTTAEVARALRLHFKFNLLPDSFFEILPPLPDHPSDLPKNLTHLFPIIKRSELRNLGSSIRELRKYFAIPPRLPESYFNLPPPKIPLPVSFKDLVPEVAHLFPLDPSNQDVGKVVQELRAKYYFKKLPSDFIISKKPLPHNPISLDKDLYPFTFQIPATNRQDALSLIDILKKDHFFHLPLGAQWISPDIPQTNKPWLPKNIADLDPSLGIGKYIPKDEKLGKTIKTLHQHYEFQSIPKSWFDTPLIPLPNNVDETNQILQENGVCICVPFLDNDFLSANIANLHQIFRFRRLPDHFITSETLPEPEFNLAPFLI